MFLAPKIFLERAPDILDRHYKFWSSTEHRAKFRADRQTHLGDPIIEMKKTKLKIWGKAQRESARRPKSDWGKIRGEGR